MEGGEARSLILGERNSRQGNPDICPKNMAGFLNFLRKNKKKRLAYKLPYKELLRSRENAP